MNKYQILKHNDGRMLAVVWPKEPIQKDFYRDISNAKLWQEDDRKYFDAMIEFEKACEQAIANGIEFKNQSDIDVIEESLHFLYVDGGQMEKMKPYPLPEGLELEIKTDQCLSVCSEQCQEHGCMGREFAFIKHEPKEETCPTCGMIKNMPINFCSDSFHLKKKPDHNDESRDELWQEAIKLWLHSETLDELKYRFRIERIK